MKLINNKYYTARTNVQINKLKKSMNPILVVMFMPSIFVIAVLCKLLNIKSEYSNITIPHFNLAFHRKYKCYNIKRTQIKRGEALGLDKRIPNSMQSRRLINYENPDQSLRKNISDSINNILKFDIIESYLSNPKFLNLKKKPYLN